MSKKTFEYSGMDFYAKKNCKDCRYTPGFVSRSYPKNDGKKGMYIDKTLCHCVVEVKTPDANESVVPKVANVLDKVNDIADKVQYASKAVPVA